MLITFLGIISANQRVANCVIGFTGRHVTADEHRRAGRDHDNVA